MKKIAILALLCAMAAIGVRGQSINVTGNLKTLGVQNAAGTNNFARFTLTNYGGVLPVVTGTGAMISDYQDFHTNVNGNLIGPTGGTATIYGNDAITPAGTLYQVCVYNAGKPFRCLLYNITAALYPSGFNLNTAQPVITAAVSTTQVTGARSYIFTQSTPATTWVINHNFNDSNVTVTCSDTTGTEIIPDTLVHNSPNQVTVTFVKPQAGSCNVFSAGYLNIASSPPANVIVGNPAGNPTINGPYSLVVGGTLNSTGGGALSGTYTGNPILSGNPSFTGPVQQTGAGTPVTQKYPMNQAGLTSFYIDYAKPSPCTSGEINYMVALNYHAADTPNYNNTTSSSTPCYGIALMTQTERTGTRGDWIWGLNPVVQYTNAGAVQAIEADCNNRYRDYTVGGTDANTYSCISAVNGSPGFKGDRGVSIIGNFQRGLFFTGWVNRAIHFAGSPGTYALYSDQNENNYMANGTWAWTDGADNPLHRFTPFANNTNVELQGTNAANSQTVWSVDNSGNFFAQSYRTGSSNPALTTGVLRCASNDNCVAFRNNANSADIAIAKNTSDQLTWNAVVIADGTHTNTLTIASGTAAMTTSAISAGNCGSTVTVSASGVATTDTITWSFNAAPAGSNAGLVAWPTSGNVNFAYCPNSAETPAAATINWRVVR